MFNWLFGKKKEDALFDIIVKAVDAGNLAEAEQHLQYMNIEPLKMIVRSIDDFNLLRRDALNAVSRKGATHEEMMAKVIKAHEKLKEVADLSRHIFG